MDDTRLLQIKDDLETALETLRVLDDELSGGAFRGEDNGHKRIRGAMRAAREALDLVVAAGAPICALQTPAGTVCYRHPDHEGSHRSADRRHTWTDADAERWDAAMKRAVQ